MKQDSEGSAGAATEALADSMSRSDDESVPSTPTAPSASTDVRVGEGGPSQQRHLQSGEQNSPTEEASPTRHFPLHRQSEAPSDEKADAALQRAYKHIATLEQSADTLRRDLQGQVADVSKTATFWQAKHSDLNQKFLRAEAAARDADMQELRRGWAALQRDRNERDAEIRALRAQVRGLKEFVSTSTGASDQTSDEVFAEGFVRLASGLQNWVLIHFRDATLDLSALDDETRAELDELVPTHPDLLPSAKIHLLQFIVSRILVDMVFNTYFVGLSSEQTGNLRQAENILRSSAPQLCENENESLVKTILHRINHIVNALTARTAKPSSPTTASPPASPKTSSTSPEARDAALSVLLNNAIQLARLLAVQKTVLRVYMPPVAPPTHFSPETMEDMGGEDEDALRGRRISCVLFAGLIKNGDENGGQIQPRNVIAKARVLCSPAA